MLDFVRRFFVSCAQIFEAYAVRTLMKFGCDWRKISHKSKCKKDSESYISITLMYQHKITSAAFLFYYTLTAGLRPYIHFLIYSQLYFLIRPQNSCILAEKCVSFMISDIKKATDFYLKDKQKSVAFSSHLIDVTALPST